MIAARCRASATGALSPPVNGRQFSRRNARKAARLSRTYDDLEQRIAELREQEQIDAVRPDLDGEQIMAILGIAPGREVGEAYRMLLEQRLEHGPMSAERAEAVLREWWAAREA